LGDIAIDSVNINRISEATPTELLVSGLPIKCNFEVGISIIVLKTEI